MKARNVMTTPVVCVTEDTSIADVSRLMIRAHVSGLPVVDENDAVVGMISEGDLLRHEVAGVDAKKPRSRWIEFFLDPRDRAEEYIKQHARTAGEIMTSPVVTVSADTDLKDVATRFEEHGVKRVPVVRGGKIVGIVSRADLLREVARARVEVRISDDDVAIRDRVKDAIKESGVNAAYLSVFVDEGDVELTGMTGSTTERKAIKLAAESVAGVRSVKDHIHLPVEHSF